MGNEPEEKKPRDLQFTKSLTLNNDKKLTKSEKEEKNQKEFNKFKNHMLNFEYYKNILKLGCRKNPVLKLLYRPESSFNNYRHQMFYFLENIPYVNYHECLQLIEIKYSHTFFNKRPNNENSPSNINKINIDFFNNNENNKEPKKGVALIKKSSFKTSNKSNVKKTATFDLTKTEQFNINNNKNIFSKSSDEPVKTFNEGILELMEKICFYDPKKIQKILLIYPINNMRWLIWLAMAKVKYREINNKMKISNKEIYEELTKKMDFNDDSLLFELHNTLKELKVYKYNWSNSLYRIIKSLTKFEQNMRYESGMNILIGVPLLISDCNEEETFFFGRYLLSISFGLGLYYFYDENEILLNYLVFIFHSLAKEKYPKIYEKLSQFKVADDLWIKKWIKTFFSSIFDLSITIRVWDCVIGVGIRFLVNYSLAILEYFEEKIMTFKKVKEFLEFFDYELRKKYQKDKDILSFRENIIALAQSYYIPDGKYQLIEKEYLGLLFMEKEKSSGPSYQFDTSRTINNYYSNNESLNDDQYHLKLILRTLIYTPTEFITNNIEEQNIMLFQKKKKIRRKSKSLVFPKAKEKMILMDKPINEPNNKDNNGLNTFEDLRLSSSYGENPEKKAQTEPFIFEEKNLLSPKDNKLKKGKEEKENGNKKDDLIDTSENKISDNNLKEKNNSDMNEEDVKDKNKEIEKSKSSSEDDNEKSKSSSEDDKDNDDDINFDFTFNDEQIPTT